MSALTLSSSSLSPPFSEQELKKQQRTQEKEHKHKHEQQEDKSKKSRAAFLSFSPYAWLSKLTAKNNAAAAKPKPSIGGFHSCFFKGASTSMSVSVSSSAASQSSLADSSPADHQAPRRLSVGNDSGNTAEAAAARRLYHRRRHYSVSGDRDLQTLRNLIPFSRAASSIPVPAPFVPALKTMPPLPSDTDEEKRPRSSRRRRRNRGGRRSFSGRPPGARVAAAMRVRCTR